MLDPREYPPLAGADPAGGAGADADPAEAAANGQSAEAFGEEVDALPVLAADPSVASRSALGTALSRMGGPTAQVATVAATGFVAGAAVVGLVHRRRRRRAVATRGASRRRPQRGGPVGELVQIVGTRSLLVDVHLLGGRD